MPDAAEADVSAMLDKLEGINSRLKRFDSDFLPLSAEMMSKLYLHRSILLGLAREALGSRERIAALEAELDAALAELGIAQDSYDPEALRA